MDEVRELINQLNIVCSGKREHNNEEYKNNDRENMPVD